MCTCVSLIQVFFHSEDLFSSLDCHLDVRCKFACLDAALLDALLDTSNLFLLKLDRLLIRVDEVLLFHQRGLKFEERQGSFNLVLSLSLSLNLSFSLSLVFVHDNVRCAKL